MPRKSKTKSSETSSEKSDKTFSIASPKILNQKEDRVSVDSHATFNIENEIEDTNSLIQSDHETKPTPVGDIVIHSSPSNKNVIKVLNTKETKHDELSSFDEHTYNINDKKKEMKKTKNMYSSLESTDKEIPKEELQLDYQETKKGKFLWSLWKLS